MLELSIWIELLLVSFMDNNFTLDLENEAATLAFGTALAHAIQPNLTIFFNGDLGAGKTTLVRGLLRGLGYAGKVKSPTYTLVEPYEMLGSLGTPVNVYHFDLYRFNDEEEWEAAGFRDFFNASSVCLIEWPEKARQLLPVADIEINFTIHQGGRSLQLKANTAAGQKCLHDIDFK
jgi:tRNA threonylcarbamoyladenosine biosynthesis protein TsaE